MRVSKRILLAQYLVWHFFDVPKEISIAWVNFLRFGAAYFSMPLLIRTFFSRWRRYGERYGRIFSPWQYFETFVFNITSRVIGMILRTLMIIAGIITEAVLFCLGPILIAGWIVLPIILAAGLVFGIALIFSNI